MTRFGGLILPFCFCPEGHQQNDDQQAPVENGTPEPSSKVILITGHKDKCQQAKEALMVGLPRIVARRFHCVAEGVFSTLKRAMQFAKRERLSESAVTATHGLVLVQCER